MVKVYSFACKDIGMSCGFKIFAARKNRLMGEIAEHVVVVHNMSSMDSATIARVREAVKIGREEVG